MIDVIAVLTESKRPRKYWSDLKSKLKSEGSEVSENIGQLKIPMVLNKAVMLQNVVGTLQEMQDKNLKK